MSEHTPEPWAAYDPESTAPKTLSAADYDRARAAVNACAGIPTEQLEGASLAQLIACSLRISQDGPKKEPHPHASDIMHRRWKWFGLLRDALVPFRKD